MLLYIHVPFCRKKCSYCAFYSLPLENGKPGADQIATYGARLLRELRLWGERLGKVPVETIFFGGGTPSLLPGRTIGMILDVVRTVFTVADTAEISAEANPDSALDDGWLFEARRAGVNRLSLGVQSFDDADLALLGRPHSARAAQAAFETARTAGFANISLDLMWGLPGLAPQAQSQFQWLRQLRLATDLQPEHISAYGLTLEQGTLLEKGHAAGALVLPKEKEQASMYLAGSEYLENRGYMQYEISNYARIGFECRHNIGYWEGADYLGLGPAAVSTMGNKRWSNPESLNEWQRAIKVGVIAPTVETLDAQAKAKEMLMLHLRMSKGLSVKDWKELTGQSFLDEYAPLIALLQKNGLAATRSGRFRLTRPGMLVSNTILAHFFEKLEANPES